MPARVSAKVDPGGNSMDSTTRLSSGGGMNPVGSRVVEKMDTANAASPASSVSQRQRSVPTRKRV